MSFTVTHSSPACYCPFPKASHSAIPSHPKLILRFRATSLQRPSSRRISTFSPARNDSIVGDSRCWSRSIGSEFLGNVMDGDDDDDEDEEEDRSLDLLIKFIQTVFKKISKRARKAVRSVLPVPISANLVEFSVNGVLLLAFLWVLRAFLEVVCTLGSVVFVSILLIRGIWSGVTYLQDRRNLKISEFDDDHHEWTGTQAAV